MSGMPTPPRGGVNAPSSVVTQSPIRSPTTRHQPQVSTLPDGQSSGCLALAWHRKRMLRGSTLPRNAARSAHCQKSCQRGFRRRLPVCSLKRQVLLLRQSQPRRAGCANACMQASHGMAQSVAYTQGIPGFVGRPLNSPPAQRPLVASAHAHQSTEHQGRPLPAFMSQQVFPFPLPGLSQFRALLCRALALALQRPATMHTWLVYTLHASAPQTPNESLCQD